MIQARLFLLTISAAALAGCTGPQPSGAPHYLPPCPPPLPQARPQNPGTECGWTGMAEDAAMARARGLGLPCRVTQRDGQPLPATMDFHAQRLNFSVARGRVVGVTRG